MDLLKLLSLYMKILFFIMKVFTNMSLEQDLEVMLLKLLDGELKIELNIGNVLTLGMITGGIKVPLKF